MENSPLGTMDRQKFLAEYWQKSACLLSAAATDFCPPLDGDDLAGLACEPEVESRLVTGRYPDHDWQVKTGPMTAADFSSLPDSGWTLLVQDVEKHYPPLASLLDRFDFLPGWRIDDLMISFAVTDGSVGPHVDQYDVFLLQAQGHRRWQISSEYDPSLVDTEALRVLRRFEPQQEWILGPGDMLYLPPGIAHYGVALDDNLTYSIGCRAPSLADWLMFLSAYYAALEDEGGRYSDPDLEAGRQPGVVSVEDIDRLRLLTGELTGIASDTLACLFADFMSRYRLVRPVEPLEPGHNSTRIVKKLSTGHSLVRNPWTRFCWASQPRSALLYAAGDEYRCNKDVARLLCSSRNYQLDQLRQAGADDELTTRLVNDGHLQIA